DPLPPIPLWAPAEALERATQFAIELEESFELRTLVAGGALDIGTAHLTFTEMAHPPETLGVRIEHDGAALAYSADTGPDADFEELTRGVELFICEATLQDVDEPWWGHLSASQVGELAKRLEVPQVMLTHLPPGRDHELSLAEARSSAGEAEVLLARDGLRLEAG
ncbi:MAG: MBL fold metallo-hydrolase, partial [Actinomycetota bacterium]